MMKSQRNIKEVIDFLRLLGANNDRTWFKAHKEQLFDPLRNAWEQDMARLISLMAEWDEKARGLDVKQAVYRIYRDIRFSHDKRPYKQYFSAVVGRGGRHCVSSGYYIHFEPDNLMLCGGVWWPAKDKLDALRRLIDAEPEEFTKLITDKRLKASGFHFEGDTLKNVPKEYPKDHPLGEFLKRKEYILVKHVDEKYFDCDDWVQRVNDDFRVLKPIHDFLDYVYDE